MTLRITLLVLVTGLFASIWIHDQPIPNPDRTFPTGLSNAEHTGRIGHMTVPRAETISNARGPVQAQKAGLKAGFLSLHILDRVVSYRESEFVADASCRLELAVEESCRSLAETGAELAKDQIANARRFPIWISKLRRADATAFLAKAISLGESELPLPDGIVPGEYRAVSNTGVVQNLTLTLDDLPRDSEFVTREVYESETRTGRWFFIRVQSEASQAVPVIAERGRHLSQEELRKQQASRMIVNAGLRIGESLKQFAEDRRRGVSVLEVLRSIRGTERISSQEAEGTRR